jgi:hypothetical protein
MSFPDSARQTPVTKSDNQEKIGQQPSEKEPPKRKMSVFGPESNEVQNENCLSFLDETLSGLQAVSKMLQDSLQELERDAAKKQEASPKPPGCHNLNKFV